jgi:transposase
MTLVTEFWHNMGMLWLPPYHSELNTREKHWIVVKNWVAASNVTFRL